MSQWLNSGLIGLVCGACARFLLPGSDPMGLIMTILVGIFGASVGTALGTYFGKLKAGQPAGWLWSIIGAMVILFGIRLF